MRVWHVPTEIQNTRSFRVGQSTPGREWPSWSTGGARGESSTPAQAKGRPISRPADFQRGGARAAPADQRCRFNDCGAEARACCSKVKGGRSMAREYGRMHGTRILTLANSERIGIIVWFLTYCA